MAVLFSVFVSDDRFVSWMMDTNKGLWLRKFDMNQDRDSHIRMKTLSCRYRYRYRVLEEKGNDSLQVSDKEKECQTREETCHMPYQT